MKVITVVLAMTDPNCASKWIAEAEALAIVASQEGRNFSHAGAELQVVWQPGVAKCAQAFLAEKVLPSSSHKMI